MIHKSDIKDLLAHAGDNLVSIFAPMDKVFPASDKNPLVVKNLIRDAEKKLMEQNPQRAADLIQKLWDLNAQTDYTHTDHGIAFYVSEEVARVMHLPFRPQPEVFVDSTFHTRYLMQGLSQNLPYYLLVISEANSRLFYGMGETLMQIEDNEFPFHHAGPSRTEPVSRTLRTDVEYEILEDTRIFLREIDDRLKDRLYKEKLPLWVAGEDEYISFIKEHTQTGKHIAGEIKDNLVHDNVNKLATRVAPMVQAYRNKLVTARLAGLEEAIGYEKYAGGLHNVWKAAQQGQVLSMLVENNYRVPGKIDPENILKIHIAKESDTSEDVHQDIVDTLIETVTTMDGEVIFVEDGKLAKHGQIAALLRFTI
ncbi:MAG: hypothetical protein M3Q97_02580 [Bacteroidota bacterium]|nr:hypothetical protein [Bacteroidota bacterium]